MLHRDTEEGIMSDILDHIGKLKGTVQILFSTITFKMGVECKALHNVIYLGPPSDMDDY